MMFFTFKWQRWVGGEGWIVLGEFSVMWVCDPIVVCSICSHDSNSAIQNQIERRLSL